MSADAWRLCPKCYARGTSARQVALKKVAESYGKVKAEVYGEMIDKAQTNFPPPAHEETLREDYEMYTDQDGQFTVSYSCSCRTCGFKFNFKHAEQIT